MLRPLCDAPLSSDWGGLAGLGLELVHPHPGCVPPLLRPSTAGLACKVCAPQRSQPRQSRTRLLALPHLGPALSRSTHTCPHTQFEIGSILCGASQNVNQLIGGRALSGVGAAGVSATALHQLSTCRSDWLTSRYGRCRSSSPSSRCSLRSPPSSRDQSCLACSAPSSACRVSSALSSVAPSQITSREHQNLQQGR